MDNTPLTFSEVRKHIRAAAPEIKFTETWGDSMNSDIFSEGDLCIVERADTAADNTVVIAEVCGENLLKRLRYVDGKAELHSDNPKYAPMQMCKWPPGSWRIVARVVFIVRKFV